MFHKPYGRRRFLQTAALFSSGLITSLVNAPRTNANDEPVEAVVIGSGFGGAVAALRLGQAGINTVVLERGRRWPITSAQNTFATFRKPDGRAAWLSTTSLDGASVDVYTGVLEFKAEDEFYVLCGAGVGGGSLIYNAITYQPTRELFYKVFPRSINYEELDSVYYPRVRSILKPSPIPNDILATKYYQSTRVFIQQAASAGLPNHLLDLSVDWNIVREEINGTKVASTIIGEHWYGINSGAKNSLDRNYLSQAEQTGFVEIVPLHTATAITEVPGYGYRVSCIQINESGEVVGRKSITCRYLFLAAGSMGTSQLLVRAKATGALPRLNDYIGEFWGSNGDTFGTRSNLPPTNRGQGGPAGAVLEHFDNPLGPITLMNFPDWDAPEGTLACLGMGLPLQRGKFTYNASTDSVRLNWPANSQENKKLMLATEYTYRILNKRNTIVNYKPRTELTLGSFWTKKRPASGYNGDGTAHPLGGAVLGKACDEYGRVMGYQGLYVVDSALIPGSTGCTNPSLTIAAIAERCMDRIIAEDLR